MVLLLVFMQLTRDLFAIAKFLFILYIENNAVGLRPLWCAVELFPQDIASAFVGRFRCGLQIFLWNKSPFQGIKQI